MIGGADRAAGLAWLDRCGVPEPRGVEWAGAVPHDEWLARVARARAFVNASRREDHGLAQLEALAAGTPLITVPSPGAYEALPIARSLAPELVAADVSAPALATALRVGLALTDRKSYAARAAAAMAPYRRDACSRRCATRSLPRSAWHESPSGGDEAAAASRHPAAPLARSASASVARVRPYACSGGAA